MCLFLFFCLCPRSDHGIAVWSTSPQKRQVCNRWPAAVGATSHNCAMPSCRAALVAGSGRQLNASCCLVSLYSYYTTTAFLYFQSRCAMGKCALCRGRTPGTFKTLCTRCHFIKDDMRTHGVEEVRQSRQRRLAVCLASPATPPKPTSGDGGRGRGVLRGEGVG